MINLTQTVIYVTKKVYDKKRKVKRQVINLKNKQKNTDMWHLLEYLDTNN